MEMKNSCSSPRDRVGDELLAKLLEENNDCGGRYGVPSVRNRCRCSGAHVNINPSPSCEPCRPEKSSADRSGDCGCDNEDCAEKTCLSAYPLAMSYTPYQEWRELYEIEEGLHHGTIFRELDLPFYPGCRNCR